MPEFSAFELISIGIGIASLICIILVPVALHKMSERKQEEMHYVAAMAQLYRRTEVPSIHATSGVPTLQQLTEGMALDARKQGVAERLYEIGLEQFNHYVNNRGGVIAESRQAMTSLAQGMSPSEVSLAESVGESLAAAASDKQEEAAESQYDLLSSPAQIYARHKQRESGAQKRIARDLAKRVPRTDYTSVKTQIATGDASLDSLLSELPIFWQSIRSLNDPVNRPKVSGRPPKPKFFHAVFVLRDQGILVDERAEKDGDWLVSTKHRLQVPYQDPVRRYHMVGEGMPLEAKGEVIVINRNPSSEWDTEYWRQRGRLDQLYLRARNGMAPDQLRKTYRLQLINKVAWTICSLVFIADLILLAVLHFLGS